MATPLVSGCAALIREALQEQGKHYASAALVKALLTNGAVNYSSSNGPGFNGEQGFRRVNIDSSITMISQSAFMDGGTQLKVSKYDTSALRVTAQADRRWESPPIPLPSGRHRLAVTLAYADPPGALLQKDVNLIVRVDGVERHSNMGSDAGFDHINNVEKIIWVVDSEGSAFTVVVQANNFTIPTAKQAFAVAWYVQPLEVSEAQAEH